MSVTLSQADLKDVERFCRWQRNKAAQYRSVVLNSHVERDTSKKTVCATAVLTALGVPEKAFTRTYSKKTGQNVWPDVLRRNGYAVRSRASKLPKNCTVGQARTKIAAIKDVPQNTMFIVRVEGHVLLLDAEGNTVVDTAPRKRDRRQVKGLLAVWKK